jgi:hypothetical protein
MARTEEFQYIVNHDTGDEDSSSRCLGVWGDANGLHQCGLSSGHVGECAYGGASLVTCTPEGWWSVRPDTTGVPVVFKTGRWPESRPC